MRGFQGMLGVKSAGLIDVATEGESRPMIDP
jgi:hypothetical protein